MRTHWKTIVAVGVLVATGWTTEARADEAAPVAAPPAPGPCDPCARSSWWCEPPPDGCPCPDLCLPDALFRVPCLDDCIEQFQKGRDASCFKLGAGAYHWINIQNQGENDVTYGYPNGGEGTYFYYFNGDIECPACGPCSPTFGAHAQLRARDDTVFRSFFDEQVWFYEAYAYVNFPSWGKIKAGKIWKRFGLDWDGTFWGNVPYYDGMKLDPDYGVSWENTWNKDGRISIDTFLQFFLAEDEVNGSIAGGDAESTTVYDEENTVVARVVPTWHVTKNTSVALGLTASFGNEAGQDGASDETLTAFAGDVTFQWCGLKAYAEVAVTDGTQNPAHYVTGGPSDQYQDLLVGVEYKLGAFTPRAVYSHGDYENPGGEQDLFLVGGTIALTKWLTLYLEYVKWTVQADGGSEIVFEDGFQIVFNWNV